MHLHWLTIYNSNLSLPLFSYPSNALELFNRPIGMSIVRIIWLNMIITNQYILYTTLCDKVCLWLATHLWFYPNTLVSSTNKTDHHDMKEILMKVALNTITLTPNSTWIHTAVLITLSSIKMINITHEGITPPLILTLLYGYGIYWENGIPGMSIMVRIVFLHCLAIFILPFECSPNWGVVQLYQLQCKFSLVWPRTHLK